MSGENGIPFYLREARKMAEIDTADELFSLDWEKIKELHEEGVPAAFREMKPKIALLDKLADDLEINEIKEINDIALLLVPHMMYKNYPLSFIENGKFTQFTQWLQKFTSVDLSGLDASGCQSLEEWLDLIDSQTILRPWITSGTSGKVSLMPFTTKETPHLAYSLNRLSFRDEPGIESRTVFKTVPHLTPVIRKGKASPQRGADNMINGVYGGREEMFVCLGGQVDSDVLWLTGRIRLAEAKGEIDQLKLSPHLKELANKIAQTRSNEPKEMEAWWEEVIKKYKGTRVSVGTSIPRLYELACFLERTGLKMEFAPNSYISTAGGNKLFNMPDGWQEKIARHIPYQLGDVYGMTEMCSGAGRRCSHGHFHLPPWIISFILNPDTMEALPRTGAQTGRYAFFDLCAETYWGGFVSGDKVTVDFDGGCPCGRKGPFVHGEIARYSETQGDDKITCQKAPFLYDEAEEFLTRL